MSKVITFGELMLRLQPYNYERFVQCDHVEFTFGGGEANVAVSLANYGMDVAYVTKLPTHAIGQAAVNSLRRYGVRFCNCSSINFIIIIWGKIITHSSSVCNLFIAYKRIHIILDIASKNPLLVGQFIVLQIFDDIHIPLLYIIEI